ncbi:MAG: hypothetical protein O7E52_01145, partial [Candidatus Poribacteria bacterium]|nr:hypothetical protein [Candidatus Poribacteria bacterium]
FRKSVKIRVICVFRVPSNKLNNLIQTYLSKFQLVLSTFSWTRYKMISVPSETSPPMVAIYLAGPNQSDNSSKVAICA